MYQLPVPAPMPGWPYPYGQDMSMAPQVHEQQQPAVGAPMGFMQPPYVPPVPMPVPPQPQPAAMHAMLPPGWGQPNPWAQHAEYWNQAAAMQAAQAPMPQQMLPPPGIQSQPPVPAPSPHPVSAPHLPQPQIAPPPEQAQVHPGQPPGQEGYTQQVPQPHVPLPQNVPPPQTVPPQQPAVPVMPPPPHHPPAAAPPTQPHQVQAVVQPNLPTMQPPQQPPPEPSQPPPGIQSVLQPSEQQQAYNQWLQQQNVPSSSSSNTPATDPRQNRAPQQPTSDPPKSGIAATTPAQGEIPQLTSQQQAIIKNFTSPVSVQDPRQSSAAGKPIDPIREPPPPPPPKKTDGLVVSSSNVGAASKQNANAPIEKEDNTISQETLSSLRVQLETLEKQIKTYQVEYQKWHQDFVKWQKQHQNHPDQKKYIDYQRQYQKMIEEQQSQLKQQYGELQKKINKRKEEQKAAAAAKTVSMIINSAAKKAKASSAQLQQNQMAVASCPGQNVPPPPTTASHNMISQASQMHDPPPPPPPPGSPGRNRRAPQHPPISMAGPAAGVPGAPIAPPVDTSGAANISSGNSLMPNVNDLHSLAESAPNPNEAVKVNRESRSLTETFISQSNFNATSQGSIEIQNGSQNQISDNTFVSSSNMTIPLLNDDERTKTSDVPTSVTIEESATAVPQPGWPDTTPKLDLPKSNLIPPLDQPLPVIDEAKVEVNESNVVPPNIQKPSNDHSQPERPYPQIPWPTGPPPNLQLGNSIPWPNELPPRPMRPEFPPNSFTDHRAWSSNIPRKPIEPSQLPPSSQMGNQNPWTSDRPLRPDEFPPSSQMGNNPWASDPAPRPSGPGNFPPISQMDNQIPWPNDHTQTPVKPGELCPALQTGNHMGWKNERPSSPRRPSELPPASPGSWPRNIPPSPMRPNEFRPNSPMGNRSPWASDRPPRPFRPDEFPPNPLNDKPEPWANNPPISRNEQPGPWLEKLRPNSPMRPERPTFGLMPPRSMENQDVWNTKPCPPIPDHDQWRGELKSHSQSERVTWPGKPPSNFHMEGQPPWHDSFSRRDGPQFDRPDVVQNHSQFNGHSPLRKDPIPDNAYEKHKGEVDHLGKMDDNDGKNEFSDTSQLRSGGLGHSMDDSPSETDVPGQPEGNLAADSIPTNSDSISTLKDADKEEIMGEIMKRPSCENPGVRCEQMPKCTSGKECKYEHPLCKANRSCIDPECPFEHFVDRDMEAVKANEGNVPVNSSVQDLMKPGPAQKQKIIMPADERAFTMGQFVDPHTTETNKGYPKPASVENLDEEYEQARAKKGKIEEDMLSLFGKNESLNLNQGGPRPFPPFRSNVPFPPSVAHQGMRDPKHAPGRFPPLQNEDHIHRHRLFDDKRDEGSRIPSLFDYSPNSMQTREADGDIPPLEKNVRDGFSSQGGREFSSFRDGPSHRDMPPWDIPFRGGMPPRDMPPRDMPPRDMPPRDMPPRDIPTRDLPPRDMLARDIPPRDFPLRDFSPRDFPPRDIPPEDLPPRNFPPRDPHLQEMPPEDFRRGDLPPRDHRDVRDVHPRDRHPLDMPPRDIHRQDMPPRDFPLKDKPPKDFLHRDLPPRDLPHQDSLGREMPGRDRPPRDMLPRDMPLRDLTPGDIPLRDLAQRNFPTRDLPSREVPSREFPSRDIPRDLPVRDVHLHPRDFPPRDSSHRDMHERDDSRDFPLRDLPRRDYPPLSIPTVVNRGLLSDGIEKADAKEGSSKKRSDDTLNKTKTEKERFSDDKADHSHHKDRESRERRVCGSPSEEDHRRQAAIGVVGKAPLPPHISDGFRKRDLPPGMGMDDRLPPPKHNRFEDPMEREYERRKREILGPGRFDEADRDRRFLDERSPSNRPPSPGFRGDRHRDNIHRQSPPRFHDDMRNPPDRFSGSRRDHPYEPHRISDGPARMEVFDYRERRTDERALPLTERMNDIDRVPPLHRFTDESVSGRPREIVDNERRYRESNIRESESAKDKTDDRRDRRNSPHRDSPHRRGSPRREHSSEHLRRSDHHDRDRSRDRDRRDRDRPRDHPRLSDSSHRNSPRPRDKDNKNEITSVTSTSIPTSELKPEIFSASDIFDTPGRERRPKNIVIILRGIPGAGKSYMAKLIKDKEAENGAQPPRILALDDYFMQDVVQTDKKGVKANAPVVKKQEYVYEADMEDAYRGSLLKAFNKTLNDGFFPMVIVDAINYKTSHFDQFWSDAKHRGFEVFISELKGDMKECLERCVHKRSEEDVKKMLKNWEEAPVYYKRLDISSLLQDAAINDVEMEEAAGDEQKEECPKKDEEEEEDMLTTFHIPKSKWEDSKEVTLAKLDGVSKRKTKDTSGNSPLLDDDDDDPYDEKEADMRLGKKRVRWADLEEKKQIDHQKKIGFSIGMDWKIFTDPNAQIPK